jgi:hypothetical protein
MSLNPGSAAKMNFKTLLADFATVFAVSLVVSVLVSLLWNLVFHRTSTIEWESSFRFAILFGVVFSWVGARRSGVSRDGAGEL